MVLCAHLHDTLFQNICLKLKSLKLFLNFYTKLNEQMSLPCYYVHTIQIQITIEFVIFWSFLV